MPETSDELKFPAGFLLAKIVAVDDRRTFGFSEGVVDGKVVQLRTRLFELRTLFLCEGEVRVSASKPAGVIEFPVVGTEILRLPPPTPNGGNAGSRTPAWFLLNDFRRLQLGAAKRAAATLARKVQEQEKAEARRIADIKRAARNHQPRGGGGHILGGPRTS